MKSKMHNVLLMVTTAGATAMIATTAITAGFLPAIPVAVGYIVVLILVAIALLDYRAGPRNYAAR